MILLGSGAALLHSLPMQDVMVDMPHATVEFHSERSFRLNGQLAGEYRDPVTGLYPAADGWVRIHANFPHHLRGVLRLLGCEADRQAVGKALLRWEAKAFETAAAAEGLCVVAMRTLDEWDAHRQGIAVAGMPVLAISQVAQGGRDTPPLQALGAGARPLSGLRVLDLTRVIAGPVAGRALAAHGAEVLAITAAHLPSLDSLVIDMGRGKRSAQLDLRQADDRATLKRLVAEADVFLQGYRPSALAQLGLGVEEVAALRPGIVYASISAYGSSGPWSGRRGFDSLVQTAAGFNAAEAEAAGATAPRPFPVAALDHTAGYHLCLGILNALAARARGGEGGWHVEVSLAQAAHWIRGLGRVPRGMEAVGLDAAMAERYLETMPSGFGELRAVRHAGSLSLTPPFWDKPSVPLGSHPPRWE